MQTFVDDDVGYLTWLEDHEDGFVINTSRRPSAAYIRLHRATCRTISGTPTRGARWTADYIKVCGTAEELHAWARAEVGGDLPECPRCR